MSRQFKFNLSMSIITGTLHEDMCAFIIIDGLILVQVKQFNYLGCELSLDGEPDFDKKK